MTEQSLGERVAAVGALDEPSRRALYTLVSRSEKPLSRDEAAEATGLSRGTAAFHLDRMAADGLLDVEFRRLTGRTGPGSGRPSKLYRRASTEIAVMIPERQYDFAAHLLADAIEESGRTGESTTAVLPRVAAAAGRAIGARTRSFTVSLEDFGFEPRDDGEGGIVLGNCPFHRLAQQHVELVCGLNVDLLRGVLEGVGDDRFEVRLEPAPGRCCVHAVPAKS